MNEEESKNNIVRRALEKYRDHFSTLKNTKTNENTHSLINEELKEGKIVVRSLDKYYHLLHDGFTKEECDFSEMNMDGANIQGVDLENLGLYIDLDKIYVPFYHPHIILQSLGRYTTDDTFILLNDSKLKGNTVVGELSNKVDRWDRVGIFSYSEDTFDDTYKEAHPEYFLDNNTPSELKEKYYQPLIKRGVIATLAYPNGEMVSLTYRQPLTFEEYQTYYEFLKGKYIDRFAISEEDYHKMRKFDSMKNKNESSKQLIKK